MRGAQGYHAAYLGHFLINGKKAAPPPKVQLNEHNIAKIESAILDAYKSMNTSPYSLLKSAFAKYYFVSNDGIQKFCKELNGVMIRTLDEDLNVQNIPYALTTIAGGSMDNKKLQSQLLSVISKLNKFQNNDGVNAKSAFLKKYSEEFPEAIPPIVSPFLACCSLVEVDLNAKKLDLCFDNWPVAFVGDGCSVNKLAGEKLAEQIGHHQIGHWSSAFCIFHGNHDEGRSYSS